VVGGEKLKMGFMGHITSNQLKNEDSKKTVELCQSSLAVSGVCYRNEADKDKACQQLAEHGRKPPLLMMKFMYLPSRCDVITKKGRLSSCRLYKHVAHLGHCAERKKALLGTDLYGGQGSKNSAHFPVSVFIAAL